MSIVSGALDRSYPRTGPLWKSGHFQSPHYPRLRSPGSPPQSPVFQMLSKVGSFEFSRFQSSFLGRFSAVLTLSPSPSRFCPWARLPPRSRGNCPSPVRRSSSAATPATPHPPALPQPPRSRQAPPRSPPARVAQRCPGDRGAA